MAQDNRPLDPAVLQDRGRSSCLVFVTTAIQSNLLKWIALGPEREYPLRQSIHLSMFYTLHCVQMGPDNIYPFKQIIHLWWCDCKLNAKQKTVGCKGRG